MDKKIIKTLVNKVYQLTLQIFLILYNNISILIAIIALFISIKSYKASNRQFKINSHNSDSLFNIQLKSQKTSNDSLINQIKVLQSITDQQLKTTSELLNISIESLKENLYAGRAKLSISDIKIEDKDAVFDERAAPKISVITRNIGTRYAYNVKAQAILVFPNFRDGRILSSMKYEATIAPQNNAAAIYLPKIDTTIFNDHFYLIIELSCFDKVIEQQQKITQYRIYTKLRGEWNFYECTMQQKQKLVEAISNID